MKQSKKILLVKIITVLPVYKRNKKDIEII